jgi:beta-glucosidase
VENWTTHNEPYVTSFLGYALGTKAPGVTDWARAVRASHHVLLSHGLVTRAFRDAGRSGRIGITLDLTVARAGRDQEGDHAAAARLDGHHNRWFLDPILRGAYPADMLALYEERTGPLDAIRDGDLETIAQPLDYLGVNFYRPNVVLAADDGSILGLRDVPLDADTTAMGWPVVPEALTELLIGLKAEYGDMPLLITENGAAFEDRMNGGEVVEDPRRVAYIESHVAAVEQALVAGVDVRGYFVWSLLDNFEWEHGYSQRFGIVYVDFETQRRVPKRSALWYSERIAAAREAAV